MDVQAPAAQRLSEPLYVVVVVQSHSGGGPLTLTLARETMEHFQFAGVVRPEFEHYVPVDATCEPVDGECALRLDSLPPGGSVRYDLTLRGRDPGIQTVQVTARLGDQSDTARATVVTK